MGTEKKKEALKLFLFPLKKKKAPNRNFGHEIVFWVRNFGHEISFFG